MTHAIYEILKLLVLSLLQSYRAPSKCGFARFAEIIAIEGFALKGLLLVSKVLNIQLRLWPVKCHSCIFHYKTLTAIL